MTFPTHPLDLIILINLCERSCNFLKPLVLFSVLSFNNNIQLKEIRRDILEPVSWTTDYVEPTLLHCTD
jgi:hypothetical protein